MTAVRFAANGGDVVALDSYGELALPLPGREVEKLLELMPVLRLLSHHNERGFRTLRLA